MTTALSAAVSGLEAHQKMLDVTGNNLANINTTAYKASSISFSELLSETISNGSQPTSDIGGTNPVQIGSGVRISTISRDMSQGNIVNTGNELDLAIEGEGYFVLSNGEQYVYTRDGSFSVDADGYLVDPATGYRVQRIGIEGESDGFQTSGDSHVRIPYDVGIPASETTEVALSGNLSADDEFDVTQTQEINSNIAFTYDTDSMATASTLIADLDQYSGTLTSGTITISGYDQDGTAFDSGLTFSVDGTTTLGDLIDHLNTNVLDGSTASLSDGQIVITDDTSGYSKTDISLSYSGDGELTMPAYFEISTVGGEETKNFTITIYDSQGGEHVLSGAFVRTDASNTWDIVLTSVTGDISEISLDSRRIEGLTFSPEDGSFSGLSGSDATQFEITFEHNPTASQTIDLNLGTEGKLDGLTQFAGSSTAVATDQDGYEAGSLSTVSISNEGIVIGTFSNGIKKNIATIQLALFQNSTGLESIGDNYFIPTANSGEAIATQAMSGGSGSIQGGALEKSNADVATEFATMIMAQNGYQANARAISVANDILRELTNLIR
ncbi:MAG: flagellar hook-basal body complex protein [Sedimentisphaerales bacterium]|nr:flagellar hook-basal body complex protein [Sedimentisphaerales bacterium]